MLEIEDLKVKQVIENRYELIQQLGDGGFAVVWEVEDTKANGDRKAIKFLKRQDALAIKLFRNEFWTLDNLKCDRIVKVQPESLYPEQKPTEDDDTLHIFVMEKVEGKTLEKLIEESVIKPENQKLSFAKSIWQFLFCRYPPLRSQITYVQIGNWLEQIAEALEYIHSEKIIHCDIKPANIIITPNGDIKLIDFGVATHTNGREYEIEFDSQSQIGGWTPKYAAPEQKNKQVLLASDFYSLGLTILSILTGQQQSPKIDESSQFPPELTAFLVRATKDDHTERYLNAEDLHNAAIDVAKSLRRKYSRWNGLRQVIKVLGIAAIATIGTLAMRSAGWLQPLELAAYDQMIRMRPDLGADPRLLIVNMTNDIEDISDQNFVELLPRLLRYQPKAIGIILRRDEKSTSTPQSQAKLKQIYKENNNIFGTCEHADSDGQKSSFPFIPEPIAPLGFGNSLEDYRQGLPDNDKAIRRNLLFYKVSLEDECKAKASISLLIADHYLQSEYLQGESIYSHTSQSTYALEKALFQSLQLGQGAYQDPKMTEFSNLFQIMLDYRSPNIAKIIPVKEIFSEDFSSKLVHDRIVLIGRASFDRSIGLVPLVTPYGNLKEMSSVELKGQMISQLISAAKGERPMLKPASFELDLIWMICTASLGGLIGWRLSSWVGQSLILLILPPSLYMICFFFFVTQGLWLGSVPIIVVAIVANFGGCVYTRYKYKLMGNM